jgi:outer membrane receptor protein involved in Fe transport
VSKFKSKSNCFRSWLMAGAAVALATGAADAQDQNVETVVVTGSLIQRSAGDMPTPTVVLSSDAILKTGQANISGLLSQLPQVQASAGAGDLTPVNSNFLTSGFGVSNVDLRNLGASRTLVLVNGRRQVTGSPTASAVDLNTIPTALIDHVDVITGGASAAYGSDAVAGVVNMVLKRDFQGIAATAQYGENSRGDGADTYGTVTIGGNFANDRANVTLSVSYEHSGAVKSKDRPLTQTDYSWFPGAFPNIGPTAFSSYGVGGRFRLTTPSTATGQLIATGGSFNPDGSGFVTSVNGFDRNPNRYIQVPVSRKVIAETGHYDIADWLSFFIETTFAESHASQQLEPFPGSSEDGLSAPVSSGGTGILIPRTNPFIALQGTGPTSLAAKLAASPTTPGLFFYRRFIDLGDRTGVVDRNMMKITGGFEGSLPVNDWKWSAYYEFGRTEESQTNSGFYDKIKLAEALNARAPLAGETVPTGGGGFVCADSIAQAAGCVPINLFGAGSITPQAAKYVGSLVTIQDHADEQVANFQANGSVFDLPAGKAKLAVGAEYRREAADFVPDAASQAGTVAGNRQPRTHGAFQVYEGFAEGLLPVLKDLPLIQYLELDGAVRYAHYSTAGNATSWNYRGVWQPVDDLRVRATESSATRAPNIAELFTPAAQTFPGFSTTQDPCSHTATPNCVAAIAALGSFIPGEPTVPGYTQAAAQGIGGDASGNPNLKPETAHTFTGGIVYTPGWLQSFQLTVDYYDIRVHGYIAALDVPSTLAACYSASAAPFASNLFCQQVIRQHDPVLGPIIKQINFPTLNLGSIKTSGVDFIADYAFAMSDLSDGLENAGAFALQLNVNYINAYNTNPGVAGSVALPSGGTIQQPHFHGRLRMSYTNDPVTVTTTVRYVGSSYVDRATLALDLPGNRGPSTMYVNLNVSYDVTKTVQVYFGANNLFDNLPPAIYPGSGYDDTGTGTVADVYDPIGLYLYGGVSFKL